MAKNINFITKGWSIKRPPLKQGGEREMCKSIEAYATEESIDTAIRTCIAHKDSLEETISYVKDQFKKIQNDYIISRFEVLSATKE